MSLKQGFKKNNKQRKVLILIPFFFNQGKEFETKLKEKKPGDLSDELRTALGMPIGPNNQLVPPPWLIAMQRYGPPPSYPSLKIPGLNAPIPEVGMEKHKINVFICHSICFLFYWHFNWKKLVMIKTAILKCCTKTHSISSPYLSLVLLIVPSHYRC